MTELALAEGRVGVGPGRHRLGQTLTEELAACMLGGYGMPFEVGLAAFNRLRDAGALDGGSSSTAELEALLREPLTVGSRTCHYRFPRQRALRLSMALTLLQGQAPPTTARGLRDWLMQVPGVGPKTAGWVVRNYLDSDEVAIIDIHVQRAGVAAGVFDPDWSPQRHYPELEGYLLAWAKEGDVSAGDLDAVIWAEQALASRTTRARRSRKQPTSVGASR
jgi:thermostable 8-oxoguanine DNA glycosylase